MSIVQTLSDRGLAPLFRTQPLEPIFQRPAYGQPAIGTCVHFYAFVLHDLFLIEFVVSRSLPTVGLLAESWQNCLWRGLVSRIPYAYARFELSCRFIYVLTDSARGLDATKVLVEHKADVNAMVSSNKGLLTIMRSFVIFLLFCVVCRPHVSFSCAI